MVMKKCLLTFFYTVIVIPCVLGFSKRIRLGGLFEEDDPSLPVFEASVHAVNKLKQTTDELANDVFFVPEVRPISKDLFEISESACLLLEKGVVAIFGPTNEVATEHVHSMCDHVEMPNIVARWDNEPARAKTFNFYPYAETLPVVFLQLVNEFDWKTYTILYDSSDSLIRMNELLKKYNPKGYTVTIRYLGNGPDYRDVLLEVKRSEELNLVIDCSFEILEEVLEQCQQVGILSDKHSVIVSHLDLQTINLEPYQYSGVNFTGVRLVKVDDPDVYATYDDYLFDLKLEEITRLRVESALIYDAVQFFARAFKTFKDNVEGDVKSLTCDGTDSWEFGGSLSSHLRTTEMKGLTGLVKFQTNGFRSDFELDIIQLKPDGLKKIGKYNSTTGVDWRMGDSSATPEEGDDIANQTFRILISLNPPYNMLKQSPTMRVGNDRYEGFAIDMIQELSKILHFNYTFIETLPDYGSKNPDGSWSGMLGAIMAGEADLAITDLTITADRESAVDFTMPFMNLGISILYRKPRKAAPSLFSFLAPFSINVWVYLIGSYILVSLMVFMVGRMCPPEWNNPYPCIEDPEQLENQFTLKNSFWFTIGAIMQQGSELAPIGMSTRMLAASWWFFCLIIVSSYTANLAAFLVAETPVRPIKNAEDLANLNGEIKYGAKKNGSTLNFFKTANYSTYEKMYKYMEENAKDVLTDTNDDGKLKVLDINQNYAFLMESTSIQYIQQRECNLTQIGGLLDAKGYGIAMRKNYKYRNKFNTATLQLQETGVIAQLRKTWWEEKRGGGGCAEESKSAAASELTLKHVGGVFLVLGIGIGLSIPFTFWESIWEIGCIARREHVSFKDEFKKEMKFVMKCKGSEKPARKRKGSSNDADPSEGGSTPPYDFVPTIVTTPADIK